MSTYDLIYADPAWNWKARSSKGEGRSAKNHYNVMDLEDMKRLAVSRIAEPRSVLLMWAVDPMIKQAVELGEAWGFELKTVGFYWVKTNKKSPVSFDGKNKMYLDDRIFFSDPSDSVSFSALPVFFTGLGYYTRANPEQCFLFTRKRDRENGIAGGGLPVKDKGVPRLIVSPVGRHSQKPEEARIRIERLFGDVRRVELFARSRRPGWEAWGNQVEGSITL
jgi:N6-adenosine-specific RNA methylase IME4